MVCGLVPARRPCVAHALPRLINSGPVKRFQQYNVSGTTDQWSESNRVNAEGCFGIRFHLF